MSDEAWNAEAEKHRLDKYGSSLDRFNVNLTASRMGDYPELLAAAAPFVSADMKARIAREFYAIARPSLARDVPWEQASPLVTEHYEQRARALLDAAPAGGAE